MKAAVLTVSDGCYHGARQDLSGQELRRLLQESNWTIVESRLVPDDVETIRQQVHAWLQLNSLDLIVSTGGTGLGPRDVTPEAILPLLEKEVPGMAELMRLRGIEKTPFAALSRSLAGAAGRTLILCLPGSPRGAADSLQAVLTLIPHAVELLKGNTEKHPDETSGSQ